MRACNLAVLSYYQEEVDKSWINSCNYMDAQLMCHVLCDDIKCQKYPVFSCMSQGGMERERITYTQHQLSGHEVSIDSLLYSVKRSTFRVDLSHPKRNT